MCEQGLLANGERKQGATAMQGIHPENSSSRVVGWQTTFAYHIYGQIRLQLGKI